jgi:hypothetical protein
VPLLRASKGQTGPFVIAICTGNQAETQMFEKFSCWHAGLIPFNRSTRKTLQHQRTGSRLQSDGIALGQFQAKGGWPGDQG